MATANTRIEILLEAAIELSDTAERAAFLERECAGDDALRARAERLLAAYKRSEKFFNDCRPALKLDGLDTANIAQPPVDEELGRTIGPYKLLQKIGEGGCGVVYMAEQQRPVRRKVALKIIKLGMDTKNVIARFEAERQALAMMDHPNIARVLDAGATETGRPYFVMELVHGIRITEYCDERRLETSRRLELFIQVTHAIQHAHQKGIIHRDIKPSNILVTMHDGVPVPKVIDFGIAKATEESLTDKTLFTAYGNFIGTPAYMSPEQAEFSGLDIDTRSDIYSLGVLLYELLTGKTPFDQKELLKSGLDEMRRTLRERDPHRPSTKLATFSALELTATATRRHIEPPQLQSLLKGDLDWIVMKCLEKDRRRRYETANGLAMDVQRHLDNEPVLARPPSRWYRFQKLVQRNRGVFAATGTIALALVIGFGTATAMFFKERQMRHRAMAAEQLETELRRQAETGENIAQAALLRSQGKFEAADALVEKTVFQQSTPEGADVLRALGEWHALNGRWQMAGTRFLQALQVDQLNDEQTVSQDFLKAGAALAAAGDSNRFEAFRRLLNARFAAERNPLLAAQLLKAGLFLPQKSSMDSFLPLARLITPAAPVSIGDPHSYYASGGAEDFLQRLKMQDIGTGQPCSITSEAGMITMVAGGSNIWEHEDAFAYACAPIVGDFDFRMRVCSITPELDEFTRIGLMARESVDQTGSRHVLVAVNANNTFQVIIRSQDGALAASVPENPLPMAFGSNSWVRLQRVGALFLAYTSSNGVDWTQLYQSTGGDRPFSDPIYFGLAASSHSRNSVATNVISNFGVTPSISADSALTLALLDYRRGNFAQSATWCQRLLDYPECSAVQLANAQVIQALAYLRLGQAAQAKWQLARAGDLIQKKFSLPLAKGNPTDGFWFDWVLVRELWSEAYS